MLRDDLIRMRHMVDSAGEAVGFVRGSGDVMSLTGSPPRQGLPGNVDDFLSIIDKGSRRITDA